MMETAILMCCIIIIVLLAVLIVKGNGKNSGSHDDAELKRQLEMLGRDSGNRSSMLMDQLNRQNETMVSQITVLGGSLRDSQEKQQARSGEQLVRLEGEMNGLRKENRESLDKINSIVTEKMQTALDEKLNGAFEAVVKNMTELGKTLNEGQDKQQKSSEAKLAKLEEGFEKIRAELIAALDSIRRSNSESMEKIRRDNTESLDKRASLKTPVQKRENMI